MDNFLGGTRNSLDGLMMPKAADVDVPKIRAKGVLDIKLNAVLDYNKGNQESVLKYHEMFDLLFRASERVRHQQKFNYGVQIDEIAMIHKREMEEMAGKLYTQAITVTFIPQDSTVTQTMEEYMIKAQETGQPLHEILPPTLLAKRLEFFSSGESSSEGQTINGGSTTENSSSGLSSRSGYVSTTEDDSISITSISTNTSGGGA